MHSHKIVCRKDAKGGAEFSRMFSEHSYRRTGATGFVTPWAATKKYSRQASLHKNSRFIGFYREKPLRFFGEK
jgi:hypothetical protein